MDLHQDAVREAAERVRLELLTRKFMIMVLGLIAVWAGIAMILTGAPDFLENWFSPWSRYAVGGWGMAFGMTIVGGVLVGDLEKHGYWSQVWGLTGVALWYVFMALAYVALVLFTGGLDIVGPGEALNPTSTGRAYVPMIYLGLAAMTATPLATMVRLGRPSRRL